jgi:hybrid cluster-associated redox disulfide protein
MLRLMRGDARNCPESAMFDPDLSMDEIMRRWPATIPVIMKQRMLCIGCPIGPFHTVSEACRAHGLDEAAVTARMRAAIDADRHGATCAGDSQQSASARADR